MAALLIFILEIPRTDTRFVYFIMFAKLGVTGDMFADYLCMYCTTLPRLSGCKM